jgi:hypothetical protein
MQFFFFCGTLLLYANLVDFQLKRITGFIVFTFHKGQYTNPHSKPLLVVGDAVIINSG